MKDDSSFPKIVLKENGQASISSNGIHSARIETAFSIEYKLGTEKAIRVLDSTIRNSSCELSKSSNKVLLFQDEVLKANIETKINPEHPMAIWRARIRNQSAQPIFLQRILLFDTCIHPENNIKNPVFYSNGWQSWSYSGAYTRDQKMHLSRLGPLRNQMILNEGTPTYFQKGMFSSDFFGVLADLETRHGWLVGFLSQRQHFSTVTADVRSTPQLHLWANGDQARLDPGVEIFTDWAVFYEFNIDDVDPLLPYLSAVAQENDVKKLPVSPSGWCSWYQYYQNISETIIEKNIDVLEQNADRLPLQLVQIDDGFQSQVGDWLEFNDRFPSGVAPLAKRIDLSGYLPGLWLAPFIVHPKSKLYKEHPDWLLGDQNGKPVNSGFVWNALNTALDLTVPGALEYACEVVRTAVQEWKFPYLKLDFLYAAALKGKYSDDRFTRAQVLHKGMQAMRQAAGADTILLGCGLPLGSAVGIVDMMRIGTDVSDSWTPQFNKISFPFKSEMHMPSARNSIQNILARAFMHDVWWVNDPDCLLVRSDTQLSIPELQTLASAIALTGGSLLLSDDLLNLSPDRIDLVASLLPPIGKRSRMVDWLDVQTPTRLRLDLSNPMGDWHVLAAFNWSDKQQIVSISPADFFLKDQEYFVSSFWEHTSWKSSNHLPLYTAALPAHGCVVLAVHPTRTGAMYVGSNLHISQGLEVTEWKDRARQLTLGLKPGGSRKVILTLN